jgi:hypothetical protein
MAFGNPALSAPSRLRTTTVKASPYDRNVLHVAGPNDRHPYAVWNRGLKADLSRLPEQSPLRTNASCPTVTRTSIHHARPSRMDIEQIFDRPKTNRDGSDLSRLPEQSPLRTNASCPTVTRTSIHHARPSRMDIEQIFDRPKTNRDGSDLPSGIKTGHCRRAREPCTRGGTVLLIGRQHAYVTTPLAHNSRFYDN